jgi:hypothetical protein
MSRIEITPGVNTIDIHWSDLVEMTIRNDIK